MKLFFAHENIKKLASKLAYLCQFGFFFLCSLDCPKWPKIEYSYWKCVSRVKTHLSSNLWINQQDWKARVRQFHIFLLLYRYAARLQNFFHILQSAFMRADLLPGTPNTKLSIHESGLNCIFREHQCVSTCYRQLMTS